VRDFFREGAALGVDGLQAGNLGVFQMAREELDLPLAVDYGFNLFNSLALDFLRDHGVGRATLSPELDFKQVEDIVLRSSLEVECLVAGQLPLMVTEHYFSEFAGAGKGKGAQGTAARQSADLYLKDRKGIMFPLLRDRQGRMHLFNARELCLVEDISRFARIGVDFLRIEGRNRDAAYVAATTRLYREGLRAYADRDFDGEELAAAAERLYPEGKTKGHYYRGVE
jgi:putative protease